MCVNLWGMKIFAIVSVVVLLMVSSSPVADHVLFDDFSYANNQLLKKNGWILRTEPGWPGVPGATWSEDGVSLLKDPADPKNRIVRMTSSTDGTGANTKQTQIC